MWLVSLIDLQSTVSWCSTRSSMYITLWGSNLLHVELPGQLVGHGKGRQSGKTLTGKTYIHCVKTTVTCVRTHLSEESNRMPVAVSHLWVYRPRSANPADWQTLQSLKFLAKTPSLLFYGVYLMDLDTDIGICGKFWQQESFLWRVLFTSIPLTERGTKMYSWIVYYWTERDDQNLQQ